MARRTVVKNDATIVNVNELIFHLKKQYPQHNEEPGAFIEDIRSQEDRSFEEISLKNFLKIHNRKREYELEEQNSYGRMDINSS